MYEIVIITADYEGWWLFDEWREDVTLSHTFNDYETMKLKYDQIYKSLEDKYPSLKRGKYNIPAFFSCCEIEYCDDCDDDMQIYHSLVVLKDKKVIEIN